MNYADHFRLGDVISITNADRPEWADGQWRVARLAQNGVFLTPLDEDGSVDEVRDSLREYWIGSPQEKP